MTIIRATCPGCGDVKMSSPELTARLCADTNQGSYAFQCPSCRGAVSRAAEPHIIDLLVGAGVPLDVWHLPAELYEIHNGALISHDDLLDFHDLLNDDSYLVELAALGEP